MTSNWLSRFNIIKHFRNSIYFRIIIYCNVYKIHINLILLPDLMNIMKNKIKTQEIWINWVTNVNCFYKGYDKDNIKNIQQAL